ncbi:centlein [Octodon degus]|uniref:Centlein n=1 Tax=Octodon degus TaxID=10160 RepID=A0A6P6EH07_OCTDE|nr:centlein [Octodon degus]
MAARSPPSPLPSPPARQLGPRSPRVAERSEVSSPAGAAPARPAAPPPCCPEGGAAGVGRGARSRNPSLHTHARTLGAVAALSTDPALRLGTWADSVPPRTCRCRAQGEPSSLNEGILVLDDCADKEFVWSLWKRLQVTSPDLTHAVSLVVEREKQKSEAKDRKVLEILQVKDAKIQELQQRESLLKQEINNLVKRKVEIEEENAFLRKEFNNLQKEFKDKSQEVKDTKECIQNKEEQNRVVIKKLEEENEKLSIHCGDLLNDLEKLREEETRWRKEKYSVDAKIKAFEDNLIEARREIEVLQSKYDALSLQLNNKQTELLQKDVDISLVRKELQELQNLYKQSSAHTAQQAELIQQLQALNADAQNVLKNQEEVHTAESQSYQKLYNELHTCFETTKSSEAVLRQSVANLQDQLVEKEQENAKLKEKLQNVEGVLHPLPQEDDSDHSAQVSHPSLSSLEALMVSQKSEIEYLQKKLKVANEQLLEHRSMNESFSEKSIMRSTEGKYKEPPVKRSRSLSPKSSFKDSEELRKLRRAERKIKNLEKALQLQSQENDELRHAHEKRRERLQMLQTNYRAVKEQLKQWEEGSGMIDTRKIQRAEPHQLQQEDSDAVWNELAYFKKENQELMIQKMNLQEELDELKVHLCIDKATIQELNRCIAEKSEEQLFRYCEDDGVKMSTSEKNGKEMSEQTLQKVIELENRLKSFEKTSKKLKEGNKQLVKENDFLKASLEQHKEAAENRKKELEQLLQESKDVDKDKTKLEVKISELEREVTSLRRQVVEANAPRNEKEELMNPVEKLQPSEGKAKSEMATTDLRAGKYDCKTTTTKVKLKAAKRKCCSGPHHTVLNHSIKVMSNVFENLSKDGWEDVSESSSDSETQTSQKLGTIIVETSQKISPAEDKRDQKQSDKTENNQRQGKKIVQMYSNVDDTTTKDYKSVKKMAFQKKNDDILKRTHTVVPARVNREKYKKITPKKSSSNIILLQERIISLQQQNSILQNAKKSAELSAKEYKEVNEKLIHQQQVSDQRLQTSRHTIKKLNLDLAGLQKENEDLLKKLESSSEITSLAGEIARVAAPHVSVTSLGSSRNVDLEMKQLQCKLKNATNELTKQTSNVKSLKLELLAKEEHIKEIHEKISRMERDITMKRHLIEDLKFRQKLNSESNENFSQMLESLEKKVKTLTEEGSNKKVLIDSLRQRLSVAVKEKSQYEQMYQKTKEELEKKDFKLTLLVSKVNETESVITEIEAAASKQLQGLARQSEQVLEDAQKKLLLSNEKVEELTVFVKALVRELQNDVHVIRQKIRELKKMQKNREACKTSTHKAQSLAASILNISRSDLEEILDTEDEVEMKKTKIDAENDKEWLLYIRRLLEGQLPFASLLLEAILEKMNESKKLLEGYFTIMKDIR